MTKAALHAEAHIDAEWDVDFGRHACRPIAGTSKWSQHSWPGGNARDIVQGGRGYGDTSNSHQAYLDKVYAWLVEHKEELSIRIILWRKTNHYDHIHIDMWPTGYRTPPCKGGVERYKYSWGEVAIGDPGPENGRWQPDGGMEILLMDLTDWVKNLSDDNLDDMRAADLYTGDSQYWKDLRDNDPTNESWERFYTDVDVNAKIGAAQ